MISVLSFAERRILVVLMIGVRGVDSLLMSLMRWKGDYDVNAAMEAGKKSLMGVPQLGRPGERSRVPVIFAR